MSAHEIGLNDLVGDVETFARRHWGTTPLLHPTDLDFSTLLDIEAAEQLLLASARRPTFRLVQGGERLPPERSTTPVRMGGETLRDVADVVKIADAVGDGATLVLQSLQRTWPPLIALCRRLELELSHPVQANAYLTPARAEGLAAHADEHDVLVLQASGRKAWTVDGLGSLTMTPGDVLYLPARARHSAESQEGPSLHLTIGILRVTYGHVVRRLLDRLEGADLSAPLPVGFANSGGADLLHEELTRHLRSVVDAMATTDLREVARHENRRAERGRRRQGRGRLQSIVALDRVDPSTIVVANADSPAQVTESDGAGRVVVLELVDRRLEMPALARPALEHLLVGDEVKVGELPGLSDASRVVLVRRLVREGWLRIVRP